MVCCNTDYEIMFINIFWPIGVQIMTYLLCAGWVAYHRYQLKDLEYDMSFFLPRAKIATAYGAYPQWRLALFSFWDQLNAIITSLPAPFIDLTSQVGWSCDGRVVTVAYTVVTAVRR